MNRLHWWIFICTIYNVKNAAVNCQYTVPYDGAGCPLPPDELYGDFSNEPGSTCAKNQLMNTLLNVAATKGLLPELASALGENLPTPQDLFISSTNNPNGVNSYPGPVQCQNVPEPYQGFSPNSIPLLPTETYFCGPDFITHLPYQSQSQQPTCNMNKYFSIPVSQDGIPVGNTETFLPTVNVPDALDTRVPCKTYQPAYKQPVVVTSDSDHIPPFNIEINVPVAQLPGQLLSLLSNEQPAPISSAICNQAPPPMDSPLPIVISKGKSRSSFKKMLPILLLAMLLDDEGCGCSNRCDCDPNFIPIPYPIPIPVNNPIICLDRKYNSAESDSHEDDIS